MTEALVLVSVSNVCLWMMGVARSILEWRRYQDRMARRRVLVAIAIMAAACVLVLWAVKEHNVFAWAQFGLGVVSGAMFSGGLVYLSGKNQR